MTNYTDYDLSTDGLTIRTPGKFEGEPRYAPYFYDLMMDGAQTDTIYDGDTPTDIFEIGDEEIAIFPELEGVDYVALWESDQGFANTAKLSASELAVFETDCLIGCDEE